jgi:hypothetical protein
MKKLTLLFLTGILILPLLSFSQSNRWKRTRYELVGGVGITTFMGDLGGGNDASHFISDYDFTAQRPLLSAGFRYKILEPLAAKASLSFGWVSGADSKSDNIYRQDRNLSFRSPIVEFGTQIEYSIIKESSSHRYSLQRGRKFSFKYLTINTYVFTGIAGFWFNPKGKDDGIGGTDKWVALQPLGTEGQGLVEGRDKYSRIQLAIPLGIGFKYALTRNISIGAEFGARYTFTDYIDDVSSTYVDAAWLAEKDPLAARMADKSIQTNDDSDPLPNVLYGPGNQRGESRYNDFYMFSLVTVSYKLRTGRNGLPKF